MTSASQLPGVFQSLAPTLDHYGYFGVGGLVFLEDFGVPVPGETVLIAASIYAGAGRMSALGVALVAFIAAVAGDNVGFLIGHFAGRAAVARFGRYLFLTEERLTKVERFFEHHGGQVIVIARFIEGLRQANGIVAGITEMSWYRFVAFNALGAALWVGLWVSLGSLAGGHIGAIYKAISKYSFIALIVLGVVAMMFIARAVRRRRARRSAEPTKTW